MGYRILRPLFPLGDVYLTAEVAALELDPDEIDRLLRRRQYGDWGDLGEEDKAANDRALEHGERLPSRYGKAAVPLYVISERDRSMTTVLLRSDY